MARSGRPRALVVRKRPTTRAGRSAAVAPTPELLAQRRRVAGDVQVPLDFPLDLLLARHRRDLARGVAPSLAGGIDPARHAAGWRYARLRWFVFGLPFPMPPMVWDDRRGAAAPDGDPDLEDRRRRALAAFRAARAALDGDGRGAARMVDQVAVRLAPPADAAALADLRRGLAALDRHFHAVRVGLRHR